MYCRRLILAGLMVLAAAQAVPAQENFNRGKTIRIVVGFSAGGGFDKYARVLARAWTDGSRRRLRSN